LKVFSVSELYFWATDLDLVHPVFLQKAFLAVYVRYGDNTGQNKAKKERPGSSRGQTGSRNMAATRFSDSAIPNSDLTESSPKYTTTSGLTTTTFLTHFSDKNKFHGISDHFGHF